MSEKVHPVVKFPSDVSRGAFETFLSESFGESKAAFLRENADWWYRGHQNQWVVEEDSRVQAFCAVVPSRVRLFGREIEAAWWVDLVVSEDARGRGLERLFDRRVRSAAPLVLGFPNELAATIHRRHGWGVREDLETRLLPLYPIEILRARRVGGHASALLGLAGHIFSPIYWNLRRRIRTHQPKTARILENPRAAEMSQVFTENHPEEALTTNRDPEYLQWRFLDAPYRKELIFIGGGSAENLRAILVLRVFDRGRYRVARLLDLFGDVADRSLVSDMIRFASRIALEHGAIQLTALSSDQTRRRILRDAGFLIGSKSRLCWRSDVAGLNERIAAIPHDFTLGDSDNDEL